MTYDYLVAKLKLFGLDGDVSDATYEKMAEGLVEIGYHQEAITRPSRRSSMAVSSSGRLTDRIEWR